MSEENRWSSRIGFILATTGAAVGLGNIWKFAYMAGAHGGSAFVLVYLLCVIGVGIPLMMGEMLLGRIGRSDAVSSMRNLAKRFKQHPSWSLVGWLGALTLLLVLSFYSVVAGWSLFYVKQTLEHHFVHMQPAQIQHIWQNLLAKPSVMLIYHSSFMALTVWVVAHGVQKGLEKAAKMMMPALFGILIILVGYAASTPGFNQGVEFLFHFDWTHITPDIAISALGHAFFTLAVGAGCILVYGAYLTDNARIGPTVVIITALDVFVAILSGLAIFPLVFTYHLAPAAGPGLMFETLPIAFAQMGGGFWFGLLFFFLLLFAAWTSSISLVEPLAALLIQRFNFKRWPACICVGITAWALGLLTIFSFNLLHSFKPFWHRNIFNLVTDIATNILLPLGGLGFTCFVAYCVPKKVLLNSLKFQYRFSFNCWYFAIRYITPIGILIILLGSWI